MSEKQHNNPAGKEQQSYDEIPSEDEQGRASASKGKGQEPSGENDKADETGEGRDAITISSGEYEELKRLAGERDDYLERLRRAVAENMNLQNRMDKLRERASWEARREIARKVVPLADSLTRARENADQTEGAESISEGLKLTEKEFYDILKELKIEPVPALGRPFDPEYHDAVYQQPSSENEPNTIVGEMKKGFLIDGQLLRPSQVVVATTPRADETDAPDSNDNTASDDGHG